ncbi:hypothetical protein ABIA16_003525 [Sinorhizobium fredii]
MDDTDGVRAAVDRIKRRSLAAADQGVSAKDLSAARERFWCGPGWHEILHDLMRDLYHVDSFRFFGASEKWGRLEVLYRCDAADQEVVSTAVRVATSCSSATCEVCGGPGSLRREGWWKVLCDEHELARKVELTDDQFEEQMRVFRQGADRWRPVVYSHPDKGRSSEEIYLEFYATFSDLDEQTRRFWAVQCTRLVLFRRRRADGMSK